MGGLSSMVGRGVRDREGGEVAAAASSPPAHNRSLISHIVSAGFCALFCTRQHVYKLDPRSQLLTPAGRGTCTMQRRAARARRSPHARAPSKPRLAGAIYSRYGSNLKPHRQQPYTDGTAHVPTWTPHPHSHGAYSHIGGIDHAMALGNAVAKEKPKTGCHRRHPSWHACWRCALCCTHSRRRASWPPPPCEPSIRRPS